MTVKILKAKTNQWYNNLVGFEFSVLGEHEHVYSIKTKDGQYRTIAKEDCELI